VIGDRRLLGEALSARGLLGLSVAAGLGTAVAVVVQAAALARAVAGVLLDGAGWARVAPAMGVFLGAVALRGAFSWASGAAAAAASARVRDRLRERLVQHLVRLGPVAVGRERAGELAGTLAEGIERLDAYIRRYLPQLALAAGIPVALILLVAARDLLSGVVLLVTVPMIPVFMVLIGKAAAARSRRQWTVLARLEAHFLEAIQGLPTLKVLGRARDEVGRIAEVSERFREATMGVLRVAFLSALALELVATISTAVVAVQVGLRLLYGHLTFEPAFFVLLLAPEVYAPLRALGAAFHSGTEGTAAAERIFGLLAQDPPRLEEGREPVPKRLHIELRGVRYVYVSRAAGTGERLALDGVDLELLPGAVTALVGPSGAGKSTLAALLLRFARPTAGEITVDGVPLARIELAAWRRAVAWVPQRPYLPAGTVAYAIRLYRPGASLAEVREAARLAGLAAEIEAMAEGYDTLLGEGGAGLSGGQARRLALARAFLADAPLVIMDEPTSHVDPELEASLVASAARLLQGRTALVIAHRLGTARRADRIAVMEAGRIVQTGRHEELAAVPGPYRSLLLAGEGGP